MVVEQREIEIFLTLAEHLHFRRTAEQLHISQARVSQTIKKLERQIGAALFDRTSRRVALTSIGRRLRDDLAPAYQQIQDAIAHAVAAGHGVDGALRLGFEAPALADHLTAPIDTFRSRHPGCLVHLREAPFHDPLGIIGTGEADVVVIQAPVTEPGLVEGPTAVVEPMVLAVSDQHPLARAQAVTLEDLARTPVLPSARPVRPYWVAPPHPWHTPGGKTIERAPATTTFQELLAAVAAGSGICPLGAHVARYFARPNITYVPFHDAPPATWRLVWPRTGETARIRAFAQHVVTSPAAPQTGADLRRRCNVTASSRPLV
ncbi:LysR family transcriptional regulator [Streptomyces sp. NBC_00286]|uniref:LysR family transcriptional regulator n=1 Tax=Streptomyces sp. NBC_00286 TaxID=2975701 RepID=UPI002E2C2894|nr:LysR family transcriptional regulator [Streptomyces sp. NBC_00286]